MRCDAIRDVLSARLDGETSELDDDLVDAHVSSCLSCTAWNEELSVLHRIVRVREAEPVPDLTASILGAFPAPRRVAPSFAPEPVSTARWALFVVALTQLVLAGPALLLGEGSGATVHVARELGSFDVALAIGLLVAAWQPARAWGLLPVAAALACVMGGTAVVDVVRGTATSVGEVHHLLDLAGVAMLWWVARDDRAVPAVGPRGPLAAS